MTRLYLTILSILTLSFTQGFGGSQSRFSPSNTTCSTNKREMPTLEAKLGYFFFSDSKMREIYSDGGLDVQLSGSYPLLRYFHLYGSVEYLEKHGRSLNFNQRTKIWEVPLSFGLKFVIPIFQKLQYYLALGPRYFFVGAYNDSSFVERDISESLLGGFTNMGFHYFVCNCLFVDLFGEYSYGKRFFNSTVPNSFGQDAQIGGFAFGAGLGYSF